MRRNVKRYLAGYLLHIHRGEYDGLSLKELAYDLRKIRVTSGLPRATPDKAEGDSRKRADAAGVSPEQELKEFYLGLMTKGARA